jgi:hypothetical protein
MANENHSKKKYLGLGDIFLKAFDIDQTKVVLPHFATFPHFATVLEPG